MIDMKPMNYVHRWTFVFAQFILPMNEILILAKNSHYSLFHFHRVNNYVVHLIQLHPQHHPQFVHYHQHQHRQCVLYHRIHQRLQTMIDRHHVDDIGIRKFQSLKSDLILSRILLFSRIRHRKDDHSPNPSSTKSTAMIIQNYLLNVNKKNREKFFV